jgi:hypothetical protein
MVPDMCLVHGRGVRGPSSCLCWPGWQVTGAFSQDDEEMLQVFLDTAAPILHESQLYQTGLKNEQGEQGAGNEFDGEDLTRRHTHPKLGSQLESFREGDEEEDEEHEDKA